MLCGLVWTGSFNMAWNQYWEQTNARQDGDTRTSARESSVIFLHRVQPRCCNMVELHRGRSETGEWYPLAKWWNNFCMRIKESTEHWFTNLVFELFNYESKKGRHDSVISMSIREEKGKKGSMEVSHKAISQIVKQSSTETIWWINAAIFSCYQ